MPDQTLNRRRQLLAKQHLFQGVSLDAIECYFDSFVSHDASTGDVILTLGQENNSLYLLLEGQVRLHLDKPDLPALHALGPGECFGEMSLIDDGRTSAYVVAASECQYLVIDEASLWGMVDASHGVARNLLFILTRRLRNDNKTISASQDQLRRWENFALSDSLTGLNNRRWLDSTLHRLVQRAERDGSPLTLIMLDVDHFKAFNDRWGHQAGDQALRSLAQIVREQLRPTDLVARYGGEEFVILLPSTSLEQAEVIAERLRAAVAGTPCGAENQAALPPVTVSMGLTSTHSGYKSSRELIASADEALYRAKQDGRNCVSRAS